MLALFVFLGKMSVELNVKVGHELEEGFKSTVKSMPTLILQVLELA